MSTITVGNHAFGVQVFRDVDERDWQTPGIAKQTPPLDESEWPITRAEIETRANEKLVESGAKADRIDDCVWCAEALGIGAAYYIRRAKSQAQRDDDHAEARSAYLRGDLT